MPPPPPPATLFPYTTLFRSPFLRALLRHRQRDAGPGAHRLGPPHRCRGRTPRRMARRGLERLQHFLRGGGGGLRGRAGACPPARDRKSTRLNSSHVEISYAV